MRMQPPQDLGLSTRAPRAGRSGAPPRACLRSTRYPALRCRCACSSYAYFYPAWAYGGIPRLAYGLSQALRSVVMTSR